MSNFGYYTRYIRISDFEPKIGGYLKRGFCLLEGRYCLFLLLRTFYVTFHKFCCLLGVFENFQHMILLIAKFHVWKKISHNLLIIGARKEILRSFLDLQLYEIFIFFLIFSGLRFVFFF